MVQKCNSYQPSAGPCLPVAICIPSLGPEKRRSLRSSCPGAANSISAALEHPVLPPLTPALSFPLPHCSISNIIVGAVSSVSCSSAVGALLDTSHTASTFCPLHQQLIGPPYHLSLKLCLRILLIRFIICTDRM